MERLKPRALRELTFRNTKLWLTSKPRSPLKLSLLKPALSPLESVNPAPSPGKKAKLSYRHSLRNLALRTTWKKRRRKTLVQL